MIIISTRFKKNKNNKKKDKKTKTKKQEEETDEDTDEQPDATDMSELESEGSAEERKHNQDKY